MQPATRYSGNPKSAAAAVQNAGSHQERLLRAEAVPANDEAPAALEPVNDPGWVIVIGMGIFFVAAAAISAMS